MLLLRMRLFKSSSQIEWNLCYRISLVVESQLVDKKLARLRTRDLDYASNKVQDPIIIMRAYNC